MRRSTQLLLATHSVWSQGRKIKFMCVSVSVYFVDCSKICYFGKMQDEFGFTIPFSRLYKMTISVCFKPWLGIARDEREGGD